MRRGSSHSLRYFAIVKSSALSFICIAPSPTSAMTGRWGYARFRRDRIGNAGVPMVASDPGEARHHPRAEDEIAREPIGRRAGVRREDRSLGQQRGELPKHSLGIDRVRRGHRAFADKISPIRESTGRRDRATCDPRSRARAGSTSGASNVHRRQGLLPSDSECR